MAKFHGKVSLTDLIHRQNTLLKCMLTAVLFNKGKGMDYKEVKKIIKSFDKAVKITEKRFMEDTRKYDPELINKLLKY